MNRLILFSAPTPPVMEFLDSNIFTRAINGKHLCYLPCNGRDPRNERYTIMWKTRAEDNGATFHFIDNTKDFESFSPERELVEQADILVIPGGNTFTLKHYLMTSGLFDSLKQFFSLQNKTYLGMSAGAIITTPTIEFANDHKFASGFDENSYQVQDLAGLNIVDFEIVVHFEPEIDASALENYVKQSPYAVRTVKNEEFLDIAA